MAELREEKANPLTPEQKAQKEAEELRKKLKTMTKEEYKAHMAAVMIQKAWRRKRARLIMKEMREAFLYATSYDVAFGNLEMDPLANPLLTSAANQQKGVSIGVHAKRRSDESRLVGHGSAVHALAQAKEDWLLSVSSDKSIRKWDIERAPREEKNNEM